MTPASDARPSASSAHGHDGHGPHDHGAHDGHDHGPGGHSHDHHHGPGHHHHPVGDEVSDRRLLLTVVLNAGIVVAQVAGAYVSRSLALAADAAHNASDVVALAMTYAARRIARRRADAHFTFGYARAETVAALLNVTVLIVLSLLLAAEAVRRMLAPAPVDADIVLVVGLGALLGNAFSVVLLWKGMASSLNVRGAVLHLIADTLTTVAVLGGALAMRLGGPAWIDPALTLLISAVIVRYSVATLREAIRVLMQTAPAGFDLPGATAAVEGLPGVESLHHVHVWRLDERRTAVEAHLAVDAHTLEQARAIRDAAARLLTTRFAVAHVTLDVEPVGLDCEACR